jgi:penicillin-binding protein 2
MHTDSQNIFFRSDSILQMPGVDRYRQRVLFVMLIVSAAFVILFGRLFYFQVIQGEALRRQSESNSIRLQSIDPTRGLIYDRNGNLLVDDRPSFNLTIVLKDAKPLERTIENLSKYIDESPEELMEKIRKQKKGAGPYQSILLKKDIGRDLMAVVETHKYDLPGISIQFKPIRNYVDGELAAHFIGYLSEINATELASKKYSANRAGDFIGKVGIEKIYESYLRGERGGKQVEVSALGREFRVLKTVNAKPGKNIYLTLDKALQKKAEKLLEGKAGAVAAMDPRTGEMLVMASSPAFDPNMFVSGLSVEQWDDLSTNPKRPLGNKVIQAYAPASVYKIVVAMAGLEEGVIDEETVFNCSGAYFFGDRSFRCWKKGGHGELSLIQALAQSCDVYFYQVGEQLGVDKIAWYATACGLGEATGIDLAHESSGLIPTAAWKKNKYNEPWQPGETLNIAIGQGYNLVTPLQALSLTAAVGNGGDRYKPQIIRTIESVEGEVLYQSEPVHLGRLPVSQATLDLVKKGLREVVAGEHGTARKYVHLPEIDISGKTGTAQVVSRKEDETENTEGEADGEKNEEEEDVHKDHAWFVAYAPSDQPRIAVTVFVEHGEHGSWVSPIAKEIIQAYLGGGEKTDMVAVLDGS